MSPGKHVDVTDKHEGGSLKIYASCASLLSCVILSEALFSL